MQDMVINGKHQGVFGGRDIVGEFNSLCSECDGLNLVEGQDHNSLRKEQEIKPEDLTSEELSFGYGFTNNHQLFEEISKRGVRNPKDMLSEVSSLEIPRSYEGGLKKLKVDEFGDGPGGKTNSGGKKLSTEEIMRVTGARYVQLSDLRYDDFFMLMHPFGHALNGLSDEETKDVELVHLLLSAAEKIGYQQFERAIRLLSRCEWIASERANPVQRIVYYFAEAVRERIDKETGWVTTKESRAREKNEIDHGLGSNLTSLTCHQHLPFIQVLHFAEIQALIENVASSRKIHVIDLEIRSGVQWIILMQALAERDQPRVELLKITALGLVEGKEKIEETGKRTMVSRPCCLEIVMRVLKSLNPCPMVVIEVEGNHNSPSFVNRFIEALFFYSAFFDCPDSCMGQDVELRMRIESISYNGIRNIVAMEGNERIARSVKLDVWRAFFARFKMMEMEFSEFALCQADLVLKKFPSWSSCMIEKNRKSVIVGSKGTPFHSLSTWKFFQRKRKAVWKLQLLNFLTLVNI
ncbi:hypothetical protein SLA2020_166310 [Shorea laevis]